MQKQFYLPFTSYLHARVNVLSRPMRTYHRFLLSTKGPCANSGDYCRRWTLGEGQGGEQGPWTILSFPATATAVVVYGFQCGGNRRSRDPQFSFHQPSVEVRFGCFLRIETQVQARNRQRNVGRAFDACHCYSIRQERKKLLNYLDTDVT
jgi:hypothetical protein